MHDGSEVRGTADAMAEGNVIVDGNLMPFVSLILSLIFFIAQSPFSIELGPLVTTRTVLSDRARPALLSYYNRNGVRLYSTTDMNVPRNPIFFSSKARFHRHFILDGRRITPTQSSSKTSASSALIKAVVDGRMCAGEVLVTFQHHQQLDTDAIYYIEVRWMKPEALSAVEGDPWAQL